MVEALESSSCESEFFSPVEEKEFSIERIREVFSHVAEQKANNNYWGCHLILNCRSCDIEKITNRENLAAFATEMVKRIDMKAYGEPQLNHFATHCPDVAGYTLIQFIETSLISGHFVDKNGDAYIDIFSCKKFNIQDAKDVVNEFLKPENINWFFLTRQA